MGQLSKPAFIRSNRKTMYVVRIPHKTMQSFYGAAAAKNVVNTFLGAHYAAIKRF